MSPSPAHHLATVISTGEHKRMRPFSSKVRARLDYRNNFVAWAGCSPPGYTKSQLWTHSPILKRSTPAFALAGGGWHASLLSTVFARPHALIREMRVTGAGPSYPHCPERLPLSPSCTLVSTFVCFSTKFATAIFLFQDDSSRKLVESFVSFVITYVIGGARPTPGRPGDNFSVSE